VLLAGNKSMQSADFWVLDTDAKVGGKVQLPGSDMQRRMCTSIEQPALKSEPQRRCAALPDSAGMGLQRLHRQQHMCCLLFLRVFICATKQVVLLLLQVLSSCGAPNTMRIPVEDDAQLSQAELSRLAAQAAVAAAAAPAQRPGSPVATCGACQQ
jgi:hypothetical protein